MSLQFDQSVRNAILDAFYAAVGASAVIRVFDGAMPANAAAADNGTKLAEYSLAASWMGASSGGQKAITNVPLTVSAVAAGEAAYFRVYAAGGVTCKGQGTISVSGGGGDMTIDNVLIAAGQNVTITSWTLVAPGG